MSLKVTYNAYLLIFSTAPNLQDAEKIAETLVTEQLVACVNFVTDIHSVYWWENAVQKEREVMMIMKTRRKHFKEVERRIKQMHSYDVPEIIAVPIQRSSEEYLNWIYTSVKR